MITESEREFLHNDRDDYYCDLGFYHIRDLKTRVICNCKCGYYSYFSDRTEMRIAKEEHRKTCQQRF